jgi:hypothetical protein
MKLKFLLIGEGFGAVMLGSTFDLTPVRGLRPLTGSFDPNRGRLDPNGGLLTLLVVKMSFFSYFGSKKNVLSQSDLRQRGTLSLQKQLSFLPPLFVSSQAIELNITGVWGGIPVALSPL